MFIGVFAVAALYADNPDFIGTWTATVGSDVYEISFSNNGRSQVRVSGGDTQETAGDWSFDGSLFRLNAVFRNAGANRPANIQWVSIASFSHDNNSFSILARNAASGTQDRITFFRSHDGSGQSATFNQNAIPQIFNAFAGNIPARSRLAVVGIAAADPNEASFYVNELTLHFVNTRNFTVVDRSSIDAVFAEQAFQLSDYVDNDTIVSIGRFIGAAVVVTGEISGTGSQKRLVLKAIDVLTSEILSMASAAL